MDIITTERENCVILTLNGNLIAGPETHEFNTIISRYIEEKKTNFILDFSEIKYINSTGLSIIFRGYLSVSKVGGKFKIANLNAKLNSLLSITKLNTLFDIEDDVETAIKNIN